MEVSGEHEQVTLKKCTNADACRPNSQCNLDKRETFTKSNVACHVWAIVKQIIVRIGSFVWPIYWDTVEKIDGFVINKFIGIKALSRIGNRLP